MKTITSDSYKAHKTMANNNKALDESVRKDRKEMLDKEFVMGVGYKQLLLEFNDALRQQLIKLHKNIFL